ncbi:MAG: protein kinase [Deltaproteobacteria bacterium]|nr:protein kinase [Deltaproteobacteria bacterium]
MITRLTEGDYLEGRYRIIRHIGEGGMGVVYEAEHVLLKRKCAVKVLHPSEAEDESMITRFKIEARSAANIRHPNIVEVMDFGLTPDNRPFFVMEFLVGESLADKLDREVRISENQAVVITEQILNGLAVAHRTGVIHRDLKPDNIFLVRNEERKEVVTILDFGISKFVGNRPSIAPPTATSGHQNLTQVGVVLGTPGYMAPETLFGAMEVDSRADLFAVGVLLFEMIMGRRPFRGRDAHEIMVATASKPVPRPSSIRPGLSQPMEQLILRALAKDPDDRVQTAQEFLKTLGAAAVGRTLSDAPPVKTKVGVPSIVPPPGGGVASTEHAAQRPPQGNAVPRREPHLTPPPDSVEAAIPMAETRHSSWVPPGQRVTTRRLKRFSFKITPGYFIFFALLGGAVYYFFIHQNPLIVTSHMDPIDQKIMDWRISGGRPSVNSAEPLEPVERPTTEDGTPIPDVVTIWLDVSPRTTKVMWDGSLLPERPLVVPGNNVPEEVRFSAPGYKEERRMVTADREQTLVVHLKKKKRKRKAH